MKLSFFVLFCIGITLISPQVNGDVVVDLFGKLQESAQKIGNDIKSVFQSNSRRNSQTKPESVKVSKPAGGDNVNNIVTSTQASVTTVKDDSKSKPNGTEQDGRENFRGACATGYERTPDGRCKPTF